MKGFTGVRGRLKGGGNKVEEEPVGSSDCSRSTYTDVP